MTIALTALKEQIQIGNESTPGTAVPAVDILLATMEAQFSSEVYFIPEDDRNLLAIDKGNRFQVQELAELKITGSVNQRLAPYLFGSTIRGNITPTNPDVTNEPKAFLWTYQGNLTAGNTPDIADGIDTYTIEYGDNLEELEAEYCFTKTLVLSGESGDAPVKFDWTLTAAKITDGNTNTAALTVQSVQYFPANMVSFYIDTSYAAIGSAAKADLLKAWTWTLETQFTPRFTASGTLTYEGVSEAAKQVVLELVYLRGTTSETERALAVTGDTTYLRIKLLGVTAIDDAQSNPPYIYLDGAFQYDLPWPAPGDEDGVRTDTVTAKSVYDATGTRDFEVAVFTDLEEWPSAS